ncbi:MAG: hypothetical protein Q9217_006851 [Psora testacea]
MYKKLSSVVGKHGTDTGRTEDVQTDNTITEKKAWKGIMGGQKFEVWLASMLLILPMVTLTGVLIALVFAYQMPYNRSSYSINNATALPLGQAYYVHYSSTTLVYIASLSSTLSTLLISAAMLLYSFSLAHDVARNSDQATASKLPSPYQLELLIRMIEGRLMVLWSYFGTKSVQYLELRPEQLTSTLAPGREFNSSCLKDPQPHGYDPPTFCMIKPNDAVNEPTLHNQTEFFRTAANYSDVNQVYLSDGYAVLGFREPPANLEFQATSFGSKTSCRDVTRLCGSSSTTGVRHPYPSMFNFVCNATNAGLNMSGNFLNILSPLNTSGMTTGPQVTPESVLNNSSLAQVTPGLIVLGGNTIAANDFSIGLQFFNDSQKQQQALKTEKYYGRSQDDHQLYWAIVWKAPFDPMASDNSQPVTKDTGAVGITNANGGGSYGILSCETNISEVTYSFSKGSMKIMSADIPRTNASIPFSVAATAQWGYDQLHLGIQQSFAAAKSPEDLAARFATFYDQILVSIPAGVMLPLPPLNAARRVKTQVTRVPQAPFWALILLNLLYATIGIILTVIALMVTMRGRGVRDAQARLSLAAVVAESFESPALGDDATEVDELYAERRGLATRRVALSRREDGGRRYRLIVEKRGESEGLLK